MLDMSFSEIAVIGVVALVVLGPERLPKVARTAGHLFGRLQRYVATVKADINREMDTSELAKIKQEIQDAAKGFEQTVQQHASVVEKETAAISQSIDPQASASAIAAAPPATQSAMLLQQEEGMRDNEAANPAIDTGLAPALTPSLAAVPPTRTSSSAKVDNAIQANLDFGIEPVRASR